MSGGNKRNGHFRMFKARRYKRIWLHSKKGKNFKGAEIWDAWWKVTEKNPVRRADNRLQRISNAIQRSLYFILRKTANY